MPKTVSVSNSFTVGDQSFGYRPYDLPIQVTGGVGIAVVHNPIPGTIRFSVPNHEVQVNSSQEHGPVTLDLDDDQNPQTKRTVVLKFDWPKDGAEPQGKLRIYYLKAGQSSMTPEELEIKNGVAQFDVPVPTTFAYSQGSLVGYWLAEQSQIQIADGQEPYVIPVHLEPAGAIHGAIAGDDSKLFTNYFYVSLLTVQEAPNVAGQHRPSTLQPFNSHDGSGKYLLSPVPLGGTYRVLAVAGPRLALSDEIKLEPANPIQQIDLKFAAGEAVSGTVTAPNGEPVVSRKVQLDCYPVESNNCGASTSTDREGKFVFEHVDPKAADYNLSVVPDTETQGFEAKHIAVSDTPLQIQLKPGLTAKGKIINVDTGKPMANVKVTLQAKNPGQAQYGLSIDAVTDRDGVFEARGLEEIEYNVPTMVGTIPPDSVILRDAVGKVTGIQWGTSSPPVIKGGQEGVTEIKRMVSPW
jgi:hypothetical protein